MATQTLALVGAAGGAGTTRLAVESGATLTRTGRDVAVFDAAYATQGLSDYVSGRISTDVTTLVTDDGELTDALYPANVETPGRLSLCPAHAPFERLARAKTAGAAERFGKQLAAAALSHDVVIVDTPPIAANQAVAAVDAADRVAAVTPDSARGSDALARLRASLTDVGATADTVVANFADDRSIAGADAYVPTSDVVDPGSAPVCLSPDETFAPAVAAMAATALDTPFDLEFPTSGRLDDLLDRWRDR